MQLLDGPWSCCLESAPNSLSVRLGILTCTLLLVVVTGCGPSLEQLQREIRQSQQKMAYRCRTECSKDSNEERNACRRLCTETPESDLCAPTEYEMSYQVNGRKPILETNMCMA